MKRPAIALLFALGTAGLLSGASQIPHPVIRSQLLAMLDESRKAAGPEAPREAGIDRGVTHQRHREQLKRILQTIGWPARDFVSADGSEAAIHLLQEECADTELLRIAQIVLNNAVLDRRAAKSDLARIVDAAHVGKGEMQLYGTQYTKTLDGRLVRFPIEDVAGVDVRRRLVGLPTLRAQEEAMGIVAPLPRAPQDVAGKGPSTRVPASRLVLPGLNSVGDVSLGMIYVHSRDDARAAEGEHSVPDELQVNHLRITHLQIAR